MTLRLPLLDERGEDADEFFGLALDGLNITCAYEFTSYEKFDTCSAFERARSASRK